MVPNIDGTMGHKIETGKHPRHGLSVLFSTRQTETVFGPRLYNSLPKYLRDIDSVKSEKFIFELNEYLEFFPDESTMPNYVTAARINSYLILGLKEFTKVEESPTRP